MEKQGSWPGCTQVRAVIEQIRAAAAGRPKGVCVRGPLFRQVTPGGPSRTCRSPISTVPRSASGISRPPPGRQQGACVQPAAGRARLGVPAPWWWRSPAGHALPGRLDHHGGRPPGSHLHLIIHPVMNVARDAGERLCARGGARRAGRGRRLRVDHAPGVDRRTDLGDLVALQQGRIRRTCSTTCVPRSATGRPCAKRLAGGITARLAELPDSIDAETQEVHAFLDWLAATTTSCCWAARDMRWSRPARATGCRIVPGSGLEPAARRR